MEAQAFIDSLFSKKRFGKKCGLEIIREYSPLLGYPEKGMKIIHVAGTNGKGSTSAAIDSILTAAGYRCGLFTSPHLVYFGERIRVSGQNIPDEDIGRLGERIINLPIFEESSMFDDVLMMALMYFKEQACDYVILETGIGGRLDSTTGISEIPLVSVITRIGLDHTEILGNTIEEIALEKAGILKAGSRLVLAENDEPAKNVILAEAEKLSVPVIFSEGIDMSGYELSLEGTYQTENMRNAVAAVRALGLDDDEIIKRGLKETIWPGRMQKLSDKPEFIIDGAHNPNGVSALKKSLETKYPDEKFIFLTSVLKDKDHMEMYRIINPLAAQYFTVTLDNPRAYSGEELARDLQGEGLEADYIFDVREALKKALSLAEDKNAILVAFGSLYFIGEVLKIYNED